MIFIIRSNPVASVPYHSHQPITNYAEEFQLKIENNMIYYIYYVHILISQTKG